MLRSHLLHSSLANVRLCCTFFTYQLSFSKLCQIGWPKIHFPELNQHIFDLSSSDFNLHHHILNTTGACLISGIYYVLTSYQVQYPRFIHVSYQAKINLGTYIVFTSGPYQASSNVWIVLPEFIPVW